MCLIRMIDCIKDCNVILQCFCSRPDSLRISIYLLAAITPE